MFIAGASFAPLLNQVAIQWAVWLIGPMVSIVLAYLTITGSSLLHLDISEHHARRELESQARARSLAEKLERYTINWQEGVLAIAEETEFDGDTLL